MQHGRCAERKAKVVGIASILEEVLLGDKSVLDELQRGRMFDLAVPHSTRLLSGALCICARGYLREHAVLHASEP